MSTANSKARYSIDELQAADLAEAQMRLDFESRLQRTREDFEEFILNAAHDLREPLRAVNVYCELLTRKTTEHPDPEADEFRRHILEGTGKIQALIAAMGEYATADARSRYFMHVDMNEVFREAGGSAHFQSGQRVAVVTSDPLPVVRGDFDKLVKVARHLLENAEKYCEEAESRTHVSSRRAGADWLFSVRDNGPGIESAYHQQIFAPFKRLHGGKYAGCGLGLSFCRKAVESHGGRIWVESKPGEGSTFCFTLPSED